ncbi:MAG: hypothetical protein JSR21_12325 [Proteobacteria bacterium]|nr:hypothetical protein [Pseudomonadota bacterium]
MFAPMEPAEQSPRVRVGQSADGTFVYDLDRSPELLPAVRGRDLEAAWDAAREAALSDRWGAPRCFRFLRSDGSVTDLALADRDARCWAGAVDRLAGIGTCYGLSILLRLLALVALLAEAPWTAAMVRLRRDGAELHPLLLRAAAQASLTDDARFDAEAIRARLGPLASLAVLNPPAPAARLAGAPP